MTVAFLLKCLLQGLPFLGNLPRVGPLVLAAMLAGEAVKTFPLSLVMISSSISFLAGVLSFSRIRNLQSLCRTSSLWTFVVQAGKERSQQGGGQGREKKREEEGRGQEERGRKERDQRVCPKAGSRQQRSLRPSWGPKAPPLPGWAWPSEVNARNAGRLTSNATSPPGCYRIFSERATVPWSLRHFFN